MQINSSKVNSVLSSKTAINKMIPSRIQNKLGIKDTAGAQSIIKNQKNTTILGRTLTAAGMKKGDREALTGAISTGSAGVADFKTGVGTHTKEAMIAKAIKSGSYRKAQEKIYGDSFKKPLQERLDHIEQVKITSIHEKLHDDAKEMLQARINEQKKAEFGNNKAGNSQSAPTNDHPKPPTGFNNFAV